MPKARTASPPKAKIDTKSKVKTKIEPRAAMHTPIQQANHAYETWLRAELGGDMIEADLRAKWKKMARGPFPFLRATYWRWAETILDVCPQLKDAPHALAVGDIHLENYGVWRDDDGRLVWGVNDFDEAADMPYPLDLVRLATSAVLARPSHDFAADSVICKAILEGYERGLKAPRPYVLDENRSWLRKLVVVSEQERAAFWEKMAALTPSPEPPPARYKKALIEAMPKGAPIHKYSHRTAGTGSLGRPRWVGITDWHGGSMVREAKALIPSAWSRVKGHPNRAIRCEEIASGRYRSPDPWYSARNGVVVRRLSPNSRKIEVKLQPGELLDPRMLRAMAHELANIHLGNGDPVRAIRKDFGKRKSNWLQTATESAVTFVNAEYSDWMFR